MRAPSVLAAAVAFALAMGALQHGGWWWLWLAVGAVVLKVTGPRFIGLAKLSPVNRYITSQNRKTRRHNRKVARRRRRENRQKMRNSKRMRRFPL